MLLLGGVLFWLLVVISLFAKVIGQEYTANARIDLLNVAGYDLKGIGSLKGQHYQFGKDKWKAMLVICGAGFVDGVVERWEFGGRRAFERKWNVEPYSFFGSKSYDSNWTAIERFKRSQTDFYHVADDTRKWGYIAGGYLLGKAGRKHNRRWVHDVFDILIVGAASGIWKSAGMYYVQHIDDF